MATDIIFPAQLPAPSARYSFDKGDGSKTTIFSSGKARRRNIHNDLRRVTKLQWQMSQIELDMFQSFYSYKLDNGANNFKIDLLLDDRGLLEYEVTPLSGLRASHFAVGYFTVNMTVLCIEQKYMTEEVYDFFDETGLPLDSIDDLLVADEALDEFVNTTLPSYLAL